MTTPKIEAVAWRYRDVDQFIDDDWRYLDLPPLRRYKEVQPLYPQQTVDALLAEVERLREDMLFVARKNNELAARAERAEAQAEADRRDAERYRVWRLQAVTGSMPDHICEMMIRARTEADVDAAIDASMPAAGIAQ